MKKLLNLIFILVSLTVSSQTQNLSLEWEQTFGGSDQDELYTTIPTSDGGCLLGGFTESNDGDIQSGNHGENDDIVGTNLDFNGVPTGYYDIEVIDENTCPALSGPYFVGKIAGPLTCNPSAIPKVICKGESTTLSPGASGGSGSYQYNWTSDPVGFTSSLENPVVNPEESTTYFLSIFDGFISANGQVTVTVIPLPIPDAGTDQSIPPGTYTFLEGTASNGSGDYQYYWTPVDKLEDATTANPQTINLYETTPFHLIVEDVQTGCVAFEPDEVIVNVNSLPTDIILSSSTVDENLPIGTVVGTFTTTDEDTGDTHTYSLVSGVGDTDNDSFTISNDELLTDEIFDYETQSSYSIRVQTDDGNGGTFSKSFIISINNLNDMVITNIIYGNPYCLNDTTGSIEIEVGDYIPPLSFLWSSGQTTQNIYNVSLGIYSITITDGEGMVLNEQFNLDPLPIFEGTNTCYLTSDGLFNVIYIDKGSENYCVDSYIVYREGSSVGVYEYIGEINSNENYFTDTTINNMTRSYSYKVSMIDKFGNESTQSTNHSTIHLSINSGTNNEVNLSWSSYIGLNPPSYSIYRKLIDEDFVLLEEISSNNNTYTDFPPEPNSLYDYYISFEVENTCDTTINLKLGDFIKIKSNYVSLGQIGVIKYLINEVKIYPNPVKDKLYVNLENVEFNVNKILLFNSTGKLVFSSEGTELKSKIIEIPTLNYNTGLYNLNLYTNQGVIYRKIVIVQ